MALDIRTMPALKLKQLSNQKGGLCTVVYTSGPYSEKSVLLEGFPKQVGITFSKVFSARFPPINKIKLADLTQPRANEVLVVGGCINAHKAILNWMISCCAGNGIQNFPIFETKKFTKYYLAREAAEILGTPYIVELMTKRMNAIAAVQVHSEDIRSLYAILGRDNALVKDIVEKTARLMAKGPKAIKAYNVYTTLAQELKEFGEDVAPIMDAAKTELDGQRRREQLHEKKESQHVIWSEQKKTAYAARTKGVRQLGLTPSPHKYNPKKKAQADAHPTVHKVIKAEKRGNGRLLLPLTDIGVGLNSDFLKPIPYTPPRQSVKDIKVDSQTEAAAPAVVEKTKEKVETSETSADVDSTTDSSNDTTLVGDGLDPIEEQVCDAFRRAVIACKAESKKE